MAYKFAEAYALKEDAKFVAKKFRNRGYRAKVKKQVFRNILTEEGDIIPKSERYDVYIKKAKLKKVV